MLPFSGLTREQDFTDGCGLWLENVLVELDEFMVAIILDEHD